jgi:ABC-type transport system involved in cytochrome bd biosynthesis fused ATPase/permease subunit
MSTPPPTPPPTPTNAKVWIDFLFAHPKRTLIIMFVLTAAIMFTVPVFRDWAIGIVLSGLTLLIPIALILRSIGIRPGRHKRKGF